MTAIEQKQKEVEEIFEHGIRIAKECGMTKEDIEAVFNVIISDY